MARTMNVLAVVKESERHIYFYDDESTAKLLETLGKHAQDREVSFTWFDAAMLSQKVRLLQKKADEEHDDAAMRM